MVSLMVFNSCSPETRVWRRSHEAPGTWPKGRREGERCQQETTLLLIALQIDEYLQTGHVQEAEAITLSERFQTLNLLSSIFTIGTAKAVELYDRFSCRSLEDVSEHFDAKEAMEWSEGAVGQGIPVGKTRQGGRAGREKRRSRNADRRRREGRMSQAEVVREWVELKDEIDEK